jgi:uncharacterized membrane protein
VSTSFTFTTQLHGGFGNATADIYAFKVEVNRLFDAILGYHAIVVDSYFRSVYEGRVVQVSAKESTLVVSMAGYYEDASTVVDDRIYPSSPTYLSTILEDSADLIDSWNKRDAEYFFALYDLAVTDPDTGSILALDFTDIKVKDAIEKCTAYGFHPSDYRHPYVAIYENRVMYVILKPIITTSAPDWMIKPGNVTSSPPSYNTNVDDVFNSIYAVYANEGSGSSKTTAATDQRSIDTYGLREGVVQNGGNPEGLSMGEDLRDYALGEFAWPRISTTIQVEGPIFSYPAGTVEDPYMIRSGHLLYVDLGDPNSIVFERTSDQVAAKTKMYVMGTSYRAANNAITLTIGNTDSDFTILMSRLGLSGGLR